jgi:hypothetical protein
MMLSLSPSSLLWLLAGLTFIVTVPVAAEDLPVATEDAAVAEELTAMRTLVHQLDGVVALTDATFEHETQASTGQTTGSWLVWFYSSINGQDSIELAGAFPTTEEWSELYTVVASVNVDGDGRDTANRLQVKSFPSFVLIHKGKMYEYPKDSTSAYSWESITSFCKDPDAVSQPRDIPAPPTLLDILRAKVAEDPTNMMLFGGVVMVLVLGLFVRAVVGHVGSKPAEDKAKVA